MELGLAITALIFSVFGFVTAAGTLIYVLARRFSTHEVVYGNQNAETQYEYELPPEVVNRDEAGGPSDATVRQRTVRMTEEEHARRERLDAMERAFEEQAEDLPIY